MINELMVDIETSGDKPGCKVLSLGAFGFDKNGNQVEFYRRFDTKSQIAQGLFDTDSTMTWWQAQGRRQSGCQHPAEVPGCLRAEAPAEDPTCSGTRPQAGKRGPG